MARSDTDKAIEILGVKEVAQTVKKPQRARRSKKAGASHKPGARRATARLIQGGKSDAVAVKGFVKSHGEPKMWTEVIRSGLPSASLKRTAELLGVSVNELSKTLRLPARTVYRRVQGGEKLTSEETERNVRVARVLARAQQLLGDDNGRAWLLEHCRGLGGDTPISLLDTSDGFVAVLDELGRLEYGVIS